MAGVRIGYSSRRGRKGTRSGRFPAERSRTPAEGRSAAAITRRVTSRRASMSDSPIDHSTIERLRAEFRARLAGVRADAGLKALQDEFLSRKSGSVTGLLKQLGTLAPDARREFGALVNALKTEIETAIDERRTAMAASRQPAGDVGVT